MERYLPLYLGKKSVIFESSRGCPNNCTYCYNLAMNKCTWRALTASETIARISDLVNRYSIGNVYYVDDNFFVDFDRGLKIAEGFHKINADWQIQGVDVLSAKRLKHDHLKLMERNGLVRLTIGAESGSQRIRKLMGKEGTISDIIDINRKLRRYNIIVFYSFISGFPSETISELKDSIKLIFKLLQENPNARTSPLYNFCPYPGTKVFEEIEEKVFHFPSKLEEWADFEFSKVNFQLSRKKHNLYQSLYNPSIFLDSKFNEYQVSAFMKFLVRLYRPIARFRVRNLWFRFMPENIIMKLFTK
jgi:radical SAM superfamily enzyme YgiQ (UPF0313 family)